VSFNGAVTVTAANSLAFYEAAFFDTVDFVNVNYVYINAAQFNDDWTITVSDSDPVPANGIGPAQVISLDLIANHVYLVDSSASGFIVFQPQNARMGRSDGVYTIPAGCVFNPYNSVLIGTWTNNGTATFRNSVSNNAIANVTPTYAGYMGGTAISISGNVTGGNLNTAGRVVATGNITGGNLISSATIFGNVDVVLGNVANVSATKTRMVTDTTFSYIQTGNGTVGSTGNIVFSPYSSPTQQVVIDTASGNLTAAGNVTAQNFTGNITITGNVTGTSANVDLVAGSYEWSFDNTGNLTLPGNTFSVNYANNTPVDIITRFEGSWNVGTGNTTQSFTVDGNNTYQMWVEGNIPNGIIAWNATVTVTNTNVPVLGQQFAWNYEGGGNILMFNSIPAQIIGTAGAISNAEPAVANTNVFSFGINNASGNVVDVRYGWIKIS
jgi:hypothetical protein